MTNNEAPHVALPKLYGAPSYARPKPTGEGTDRRFDPDDLPLEAERTEEEAEIVRELAGRPYGGHEPAPTSSPVSASPTDTPAASPARSPSASLRPRRFRLRAITERLRPPGPAEA